jgi:HSP20 family protein
MKTLLPAYAPLTFERLNQMMETAFGPQTELLPWNPPVDIKETDKEYAFFFELPGLTREDIKCEMSGDVLTVWGRRVEPEEEKRFGNYIRRERFYGEFKRFFKLDYPVATTGIKAEFKNGLLSIIVPKLEAAQPHKIEVRF